MDPIKEALTFDDVTLAPRYSEILPSQVNTSTYLRNDYKIRYSFIVFSNGYSNRVQNGNRN